MDIDKLRIVVAAVPSGRWATYADVAAAIAVPPAAALRINQALIRYAVPDAHRVLKGRRARRATALGDAVAVRARLEAEGVTFDERDRAPAAARWRPDAADAGPRRRSGALRGC